MHIILFISILILVLLGPGIWVRHTIKRYSQPDDRYDMTGETLARRLLDAHGMHEVKTELAEGGDHYDPVAKVVRLSAPNLEGKSLAAITIAAHEVGHALQDATGYAPLKLRTRLVRWVGPLEKAGALLLMMTPLIVALTRVPVAGGMMLAGGLASLGSAVVVHLLTLPTEIDASFRRALPMLDRYSVLYEGDEPHARRLLRAAAMTYVAASLMSLLNIARWWAILRR